MLPRVTWLLASPVARSKNCVTTGAGAVGDSFAEGGGVAQAFGEAGGGFGVEAQGVARGVEGVFGVGEHATDAGVEAGDVAHVDAVTVGKARSIVRSNPARTAAMVSGFTVAPSATIRSASAGRSSEPTGDTRA